MHSTVRAILFPFNSETVTACGGSLPCTLSATSTTARLMQRASQTRPSSPSSGNQLPLRWPRVRNYRKSRSSTKLTDHRFDLDAQLRNLARRNFQNPARAVGGGIRHADGPYRAVPVHD